MLNLLAGFLTLAGYAPYIRSILLRKTVPNPISWLIWSGNGFLLIGTYFMLGSVSGLGLAAGALLGQIVIALLSFRFGRGTVNRIDISSLTGALIAAALWIFTSSAFLPHILTNIIDFFGWIPTARKTASHPHTEDLVSWILWTAGAAISVLSISQWTIAEALYPVHILTTDGIVVLMIASHRLSQKRGDTP